MITCHKCGASNPFEAKTCSQCGVDLLSGKSWGERLGALGCGLLIFIVLGAISLQLGTSWGWLGWVSIAFLLAAAWYAVSGTSLADRYRLRAERHRDTDPEQAIADYSQAINLNPKRGLLYFGRGQVYEKMGRKEEALSDFESALKLGGISSIRAGQAQASIGAIKKEFARIAASLCPKCGNPVAPTDQNCPSCQINLAWARQNPDQLEK